MKKLLFLSIISTFLVTGLSGCYKTCTDPFAVNYTLKGDCMDLTTGITGTYTGQLKDTTVGIVSASNITIQVTKVDDSHIAVASSGSAAFVGFNALMSQSQNGYYFAVPSQTTNSIQVYGVGAAFGAAADGVYTTLTKQLIFYVVAGPQYEIFTGTQQ